MSTNSMANQTGVKLFLYRRIEINFAEERIYIAKTKKENDLSIKDDAVESRKPSLAGSGNPNTIFFDQIVKVTNKDLCLESFQSKPVYKFQIHLITTEREYALFARTKKERSVVVREI